MYKTLDREGDDVIDVRTKEGRAELRRVYTTKRTTALLDYIDELEDKVLVLENGLRGDTP